MTEASQTPAAGKSAHDTSLTLLQRMRSNEAEAWRVFVQLYTPLLYHWCSRSGVQGADADDVLQEVFRAASAGLAAFRHDRQGDSFRGWLRVITRNMILLHFRRQGRHAQASGGTDAFVRLQEVADIADLSEGENEKEMDSLRWRALEMVKGEFEERTWSMFWRSFVDDRPPALVAEEMGVTPAAVRKAKSRVLHRLKEEFAELVL